MHPVSLDGSPEVFGGTFGGDRLLEQLRLLLEEGTLAGDTL